MYDGERIFAPVYESVVPPINSVIHAINAAPRALYQASMQATRAVAGKLGEYADAMSGKSSPNDDDTRGLMVEKKHRQFLDTLRSRDMAAYRRLLEAAAEFAAAPADQRDAVLRARFLPAGVPGGAAAGPAPSSPSATSAAAV